MAHVGHCGFGGCAQDPAAEQSTQSVAMSHLAYQAQLWPRLLHDAYFALGHFMTLVAQPAIVITPLK